MKHILLFIWAILVNFQAIAQIPERKNRALVYKTTATWCYPCGTWGWDLANAINSDLGDDIIYLALFNSSDGSYNNAAFYNAVAITLAFNFRHSSWPSFGVNGINLTDINRGQSAAIKRACYDSVAAFNAGPVIANAASSVSIDVAGEIEVNTDMTFFKEAEGEFYLATYLVEEGALNQQRGQNGLVEHKGVLRVALDSLEWGALVASGDIDSGFSTSKHYKYTVSETDWDLSKLVVYNIIWKRAGTKYEYINGSKHRPGSASIDYLFRDFGELNLYPNPTVERVNIPLGRGQKKAFEITIYDISGRIVLNQRYQPTQLDELSLSVVDLNPGVYIIELNSPQARSVGKMLIQR